MYRIGIDLGGTNIAAGVVDESQHIVADAARRTVSPRNLKLRSTLASTFT